MSHRDRHRPSPRTAGLVGLAAACLVAVTACDPDARRPTADPIPDQPPVSGACTPGVADSDPFADCVDSLVPGPGASFGHDALPGVVLGPPVPAMGGGGTTDVASLGCGGSITLMFDGEGLRDRPGDDLIVFENAFATGTSTFAEPAQVLVSIDGVDWYGWPCAPTGEDPPPSGCAGVTPTAHAADTAFDPTRAGGDAFDLAELGIDQAHWVRLLDRTEAHYGDRMWCSGTSGGFDLDAVAAAVPWPRTRWGPAPQDADR